MNLFNNLFIYLFIYLNFKTVIHSLIFMSGYNLINVPKLKC